MVQPLAGEWAVRRSLLEQLAVPSGYGVELACLIDTFARHGLDAIAQVDLGARAHRHQTVRDLGVMAAELLVVAERRRGRAGEPDEATVWQFERTSPDGGAGSWRPRPVPLAERPPVASLPAAGGRTPC